MLHWNVFIENFNGKKIEIVDLFDGSYCRKEFKDALKKSKGNKEEFGKLIRSALMYRYWSRCEYEIILTSWPPPKTDDFQDMKIDVFDQVNLNWDAFLDYVWEHRKEL